VLSGFDPRSLEAVPVFMTQLVKDRSLQAEPHGCIQASRPKLKQGPCLCPNNLGCAPRVMPSQAVTWAKV
jgi:hypothetical protein